MHNLRLHEVNTVEIDIDKEGWQFKGWEEKQIIPTYIPSDIQFLDVTKINSSQREEIVNLLSEYNDYYQKKASTIFSFEDWLSQTHPSSDIVLSDPQSVKPEDIREP